MARREPTRLTAPDVPPQEPRPYGEERHARLLDRMGQILADASPAAWKRIDAKFLMLAGVCEIHLTVVQKNGARPWVEPVPDLVETAAEIRSIMYRPGRGTWFGMRFMMDPPSAYWVIYNRAFDPLWDPPPSTEEWRHDLTVFPRADPHVPPWLRRRLGEPSPHQQEQ